MATKHKPKKLNLPTKSNIVVLLVLCWQIQHSAALFNPAQTNNPLNCLDEGEVTSLGPRCRQLRIYNPLEWARMSIDDARELGRYCSCRLVQLDWASAYDFHPATRRVFNMVRGVLQMEKYRSKYPPQLWSDIDVVVNGYSIFLSTKEYFQKRKGDASLAFFKESDFDREAHLRDIRFVCFHVAKDEFSYYQFLENLQKINPVHFYSVLRTNPEINLIYQASKSCKLFILHRLNEFKRKAPENEFYWTNQNSLRPSDVEDFNQLQSNNNIDLALKDLSLRLFNCRHWHTPDASLQALEVECPMMMAETVPAEWLEKNSEPGDRSQMALKCGCQLLALNASWVDIIKDKNLEVMSKALTSYMNQNQLPVIGDKETSTWEYYAWFDRVMDKFIKNRKMSVKEIVKFKRGQDPSDEINQKTGDEEEALTMLRVGCNRLMFNHIKGSSQGDPIRPVKYLDNLRYISQDPLFVFHLTLLDANLFKLHALSRMCEPVIH